MHRSTTALLLVAGFTIFAASCTSSADPTTTTTTVPPTTTTTTEPPTTTTSTEPPTTTTTTEPDLVIPDSINGLPADEDLIDRRVVAIKMDNHPNARPQSGLEKADAVFEILVEGGITRFISLFHQTDLDYVGPNRSGRPTDSKVIAALSGAPFQISGAQGWVQDIFRKDDVNVVYDNGQTTYRMNHRSAPHNLYTSSVRIRQWADEQGWPDVSPGNLFTYGEATTGNPQATNISVAFSGATPSVWEWDGEQYLRSHGTEPHEWVDADGETGQVAFDTLVVMRMRKYTARNPAGTGTSLPTVETIGEGEAVVFYNGEVVEGSWARELITDPFLLSLPDGSDLILPPGRVWVSLQPNDQDLVWD